MSRPAVFSDLPFADALAHARDRGLLLIVDATAKWCGPCQAMDRGAWADPEVGAWLRENAVAVQFDVDRDVALSKHLAITAMPTIVAFRGGEVFDRVVGLRQPRQLLDWLDGVKRGETPAPPPPEPVRRGHSPMKERYRYAVSLLEDDRPAAATDELLWLWQHALDEDSFFAGIRSSYMAETIKTLMARHPPARARFAALRDELTPRATEPGATDDELHDWIVLNEMLGDEDATVSWFDRVKAHFSLSPGPRHTFEVRVVPMLLGRGRWAEVGRLYSDGLTALRTKQRSLDVLRSDSLPEPMRSQIEEFSRNQYVVEAARLRACLLAAGREREAAEVAEAARAHQPGESLERAFVELEREALASGSR